MKLAVISCIHGNYEALNAVLSDIDRHHADQIYCLGDLVGYGPHPNGVVELIRSMDIPTCQGCWDEDVVEGLNSCECSFPSLLAEKRGRLAHDWTTQELHQENKEFLAELPLVLRDGDRAFVHGSPNSQHEYLLADMAAFTAYERALDSGAEILFCAHTHIPYVRTFDQIELAFQVRSQPSFLAPETPFTSPVRQIINAGSVGEPRHGRPNATYVIYDTDDRRTTFQEVEYDYRKTCAAIVEKGLPNIFAWRLSQGLEYAEKAEDSSHVCER
jgi:diadenosine tetraphosphatase ApaH/serine/threonine PP2A family protein phosphatase